MTVTQVDPVLQRARVATTFAFTVQALSLAILVTRTPTLKTRLDLSDGELGLLLVLVPIVAAVGSVIAGTLAPRVGSKAVLRVAGPLVPLSVVVVGFSYDIWLTVGALVAFGVALGAADASMNMQATSVQHSYGRPIIASCYAWFSLASLIGALLASGAAATEFGLGAFFLVCAIIVVPVQVSLGRFLLADAVVVEHRPPARVPWRPILLIGLGLMFASILESAARLIRASRGSVMPVALHASLPSPALTRHARRWQTLVQLAWYVTISSPHCRSCFRTAAARRHCPMPPLSRQRTPNSATTAQSHQLRRYAATFLALVAVPTIVSVCRRRAK